MSAADGASSQGRPALGLTRALALGLAQGPTELLPISSSAHTALLSQLAGWDYDELDAGARKSFELALHGGAGLALVLALRTELTAWARAARPRALVAFGLALAPPALAGVALRGSIERRAGGAGALAAGMVAGAAAMALADCATDSRGRPCADVRPADGLVLGAAQAFALMPGVSRSGAALAAARARGFGRPGAQTLSLALALPLLVGAGAADAAGIAGAPGPAARPPGASARAVGAAAAFASTLASARLLLRRGWRERPLLPYALYRCAVAALVLGARRAPAMTR